MSCPRHTKTNPVDPFFFNQDLKEELYAPTWENVNTILLSFDSSNCMKKNGVDFNNQEQVESQWKQIMGEVLPKDGRLKQVQVSAEQSVWARVKNSGMPLYNLDLNYPNYGQLGDSHLKTLNEWGKIQGLESFDDAIAELGVQTDIVDPFTPPTDPFDEISNILQNFDPIGCMKNNIDFSNQTEVIHSWDIIMDAVLPHDGRVHKVKVGIEEDDFVWARNQPAAMPRYDLPLDFPNLGQLGDYHLKALNDWGKSMGLKSYDDAINTLGKESVPLEAPRELPQYPLRTQRKYIRRNVDDIYANPEWKFRILEGFRKLRDPELFPRLYPDSPLVDQGEWGDIASIHGGPHQYYNGEKVDMWCWHHCFQFLPWHRPWLASMEDALGTAGNWLDEEKGILGLPYWDQTKSYDSTNDQGEPTQSWLNGHPLFFDEFYFDPEYPDVPIENPLCTKYAYTPFAEDGTVNKDDNGNIQLRNVVRGWKTDKNGKPIPSYAPNEKWISDGIFDFSLATHSTIAGQQEETLVDWMLDELSLVPAETFYLREKQPSLGQTLEIGCAGLVENVHDMIHNNIGPDCQDATLAGWDPILYFFHSNIDRELQAIIDLHPDFLGWLNRYPGYDTTDVETDMTVYHVEPPFPAEYHDLLKSHLGLQPDEPLPLYKDCFNKNYFRYEYDTPYLFPPATIQNVGHIELSFTPPHEGFIAQIKHANSEEIFGTIGFLGMTMNNGTMRMPPGPTSFRRSIRFVPGQALDFRMFDENSFVLASVDQTHPEIEALNVGSIGKLPEKYKFKIHYPTGIFFDANRNVEE